MTCTMPINWYPDELVFLKKNYFSLTNSELNEAINSRRQEPVALSTMLNQCQRMGLKRGIQIRWSLEDVAYLERHYKTMGDKELAMKLTRRKKTFRVIDGKRVYRKFTKKHIEKKRELLGLKRTDKQVLAIRKRNIKLGLTFAFSKEKHAWNNGKRPVANEGDIRNWKDQYGNYKRQIKIDGKFIPYTRWFYMNKIGPVQPNEIVFHIDFDALNDEPENLEVRNEKYKVTRISDCYRALPLIQARIEKHISAAPRMSYMQPAEKLEYHKTLIYLKGIEKKITNRINKYEMKAKVYSRENCKYKTNGKSAISLSKSGVISISSQAIEKIGLTAGDKILMVQDEEKPTDWYIQKTEEEHGFVLRKSTKHLAFNAKSIVIDLLKSLGKELQSTSFILATEPTEEVYYAIITKSGK